MLKSKKLTKFIVILVVSLFLSVVTLLGTLGTVWTRWDFQVLDVFYRQVVKYGYGPKLSSQIVYVTITDGSYNYFGKNILDRADIANVNDALAILGPEAVAYDIIFARQSNPTSDQRFTESLKNLERVYLPIGFELSGQVHSFRWEEGIAYERFRSDYLKKPMEKGTSNPLHAIRALMQFDDFSEAAFNAGHISASSDPDGVYRHVAMLLKIDSLYFPTLALSMFLDYVKVSFEEIIVDWGHTITIPATTNSFLDRDAIIPIDDRGRAFIPYAQVWGQDFEKMEAHALLKHFEDEGLRGNLTRFFEGKFVFIGDISVGTSDLGQTPLETIPLVVLHASMLNGLLTHTFYREWSFWQVIGFICLISLLLGFSALPRSSFVLYIVGGVVLVSIIGLTWLQFTHFSLFPIVTVGGSFLLIFSGIIIGLQLAISKDQAFIRNAFSKYVPEKVVNELLNHPELLQLGGEERVLSVLFSDLAGFTTISEKMAPPDLARLLNEYLTEMTDLVLEEGGIIDKYEGDAIMAEFGAPLPVPNHADIAVRTGLKMQRRLKELREIWRENGLPELQCRVGINTGSMVIGNMGSHRVFDYTVLGDAVNLASRLESANKQYQTFLMISEFTSKELSPDMFRARILDVIKVKGKSKAVKVYEVYGETSETIDRNDLLYYQTY
ncbi:MAG: adenylate/guanylate cyclase domain-containing protein, partial [Candidatus Tectomicrobia bacterium]|nr:adenylate/guanylate cyclase domain-containing protein [Candidatus Tectomicrobia bacterium]